MATLLDAAGRAAHPLQPGLTLTLTQTPTLTPNPNPNPNPSKVALLTLFNLVWLPMLVIFIGDDGVSPRYRAAEYFTEDAELHGGGPHYPTCRESRGYLSGYRECTPLATLAWMVDAVFLLDMALAFRLVVTV